MTIIYCAFVLASFAGVLNVKLVAVLSARSVPGVFQTFTPVTSARFAPVTVTTVPPAVGPLLGETPLTVKAGWPLKVTMATALSMLAAVIIPLVT